jgi:hypothetical protein
MTKTVISVPPDMSASDALAYLYRQGVGGAPVVERERVEGVVTISDLAAPRPYARETGPFHRPHNGGPEWQVREVMTESAVTHRPPPGCGSRAPADRDRGARRRRPGPVTGRDTQGSTHRGTTSHARAQLTGDLVIHGIAVT